MCLIIILTSLTFLRALVLCLPWAVTLFHKLIRAFQKVMKRSGAIPRRQDTDLDTAEGTPGAQKRLPVRL